MKSSSFSNSQKRWERMNQLVEENQIISARTYNLIMGLVVLYGLVINFILCATVDVVSLITTVSPILLIIIYLVLAFSGSAIATKSNNAFISFLGYNLVVLPLGVLVSIVVFAYGGLGSDVVMGAFYYTTLITAIMVLASILFPNFFSRIGGVLGVALFGLLIAGIIMNFLGGYGNIYSFLVAVLFSFYIGYDVYRSQQFPKTADNAVDCALDIYLDIINLFIRILEILGRSNGSRSSRR